MSLTQSREGRGNAVENGRKRKGKEKRGKRGRRQEKELSRNRTTISLEAKVGG
jgi:hypothetical protein